MDDFEVFDVEPVLIVDGITEVFVEVDLDFARFGITVLVLSVDADGELSATEDVDLEEVGICDTEAA